MLDCAAIQRRCPGVALGAGKRGNSVLSGLLDLPAWGYVAYALIVTHLTIVSVTIFLHRHQAHHALDLHPVASHLFRFWLWLTTGMVTREWIAIHRKHHARVEVCGDPHSPQLEGIRKVLLEGTELYRVEVRRPGTLERYGHGAPEDWIEHHLYQRHSSRGYVAVLLINLALFGPIGLTIWAVQMLWIPVLAAGVINGLGHWGGYRGYETADSSTNIIPLGLLIGGEELHNNHHAFASSAKFSSRWWEFDVGWLYIRALQRMGLARVKKLPPNPVVVPGKRLDRDSVTAIITGRFQVMSQYAKVVAQVYAEELRRVDASKRTLLKSAKALMIREESTLSHEARERLQSILQHSQSLETVYRYKQRLKAIWQERSASHEGLLAALEQWCREAEETGIRALQEFARTLPGYSLAPA